MTLFFALLLLTNACAAIGPELLTTESRPSTLAVDRVEMVRTVDADVCTIKKKFKHNVTDSARQLKG